MIRTIALVGALFFASPALAQDLQLPALSPHASVSQTVGVVDVTVDYSSPGKRERTVWGDLVPYGEMWRTGANAPTTLETSGDIKVGGKDVPAGKYAVLTIPGEEEWTVILHTDPGARAGSNYDKGAEQARFTAKPAKAGERERLTFLFADTTAKSTDLQLVWDGVRVSLPIEVDTDGLVQKSIDDYVDNAAGGLARAARHLGENGDLDGAIKLLNHSIAIDKSWYNVWLKADFLHQKEEHKEAKLLAKEALDLGNEAGDGFFWKSRVEKAVAEWPRK